MALTQKNIGQRLMELRKSKGLSQEDLAKQIKISRSSLAQIELGNRGVDIVELQRLAETLQFSIDEFLSADFPPVDDESKIMASREKQHIRVSRPSFNADKLENVLLYILERCAGKPNAGETVIYKLLYFSDFNYYELYEEHLTGASYKKFPFGPVPLKLDKVISKMIERNRLKRIKVEYHDYLQTRYIPLVKPDLMKLKASEKEVIDKVIAQMSDWSAVAISNYSHQDIPWKATAEGDEIDFELALYRQAPFSVRNYGNETR